MVNIELTVPRPQLFLKLMVCVSAWTPTAAAKASAKADTMDLRENMMFYK